MRKKTKYLEINKYLSVQNLTSSSCSVFGVCACALIHVQAPLLPSRCELVAPRRVRSQTLDSPPPPSRAPSSIGCRLSTRTSTSYKPGGLTPSPGSNFLGKSEQHHQEKIARAETSGAQLKICFSFFFSRRLELPTFAPESSRV